jgi:hypothetical protein
MGDWSCPNCNELCFSSRSECKKCKACKPMFINKSTMDSLKSLRMAPEPPILARIGDWKCLKCNMVLYATKIVCKCGEERPGLRRNHPSGDDEVTTESPCVICLTNKKVIASINCGHNCLCISCSKCIYNLTSPKCPICRGNWTNLIKIY